MIMLDNYIGDATFLNGLMTWKMWILISHEMDYESHHFYSSKVPMRFMGGSNWIWMEELTFVVIPLALSINWRKLFDAILQFDCTKWILVSNLLVARRSSWWSSVFVFSICLSPEILLYLPNDKFQRGFGVCVKTICICSFIFRTGSFSNGCAKCWALFSCHWSYGRKF